MDETGGECRCGEVRNLHYGRVRKLEEERPCGGPTRKWEDNIKIYLLEIPFDDLEHGKSFRPCQ
jgi:hypothetical protein